MKKPGGPRSVRFVLLFVLMAAGLGHADQVTLENGDRLTGKVKRVSDAKLIISTEAMGDVKIDLKRVTSLETDSDMTVVLDDDARLYGRLRGDGHQLQILDGGESIDVARVKQIEPGHVTGEEWKFSGHFLLGASDSSGNTEAQSLSWDGEFAARQARNRYTVGGRGNYGRGDETETENNTVLYAQYDRFISKKWYGYANTSLENNRFNDIYLRAVAGGGVGYQWFDTARMRLALEAGPTYVYADYYDQPTKHYPGARLATKFDYWIWQDAVQFFNNNEFYPALQKDQDSFLRSQTGLRFPLTDKLTGVVQLNLDWNSNPPPGKVELDRTVILSLGYRW